MGKSGELRSLRVEAINTMVFGCHPDKTLAVFKQSEYVVVRQSAGVSGIVLIIAETFCFRIEA